MRRHLLLSLSLILLIACQPAERPASDTHAGKSDSGQSRPSARPAAVKKAASLPQRSAPLPDNPWEALSVLSPAELDAVRQVFLARKRQGGHAPLERKVDYMLQVLISAYQGLLHPGGRMSRFMPPSAEGFSLTSHDGLPLKAAYVPAAKKTDKGVILLHGYAANKEFVWHKYGFLHSDYNLLLYDQRGHNGQQGAVTLGAHEAQDLQIAIRALRGRGNTSFALLGESLGGAVAIVGGAQWVQSPDQQSFPLEAVWSDAAYADLEHAIGERAVARLSYEAPNLPEAARKQAAALIQSVFLSWLEADLGLRDLESKSAPRLFLPTLVKHAAYAQVHSSEDAQTSYANARLLEAVARQHAAGPPLFWTTTGEHVESWRLAAYAPKVKEFFKSAFGR